MYKVSNEFSWFGWPDWPRNVSAQFFGCSGKVLYGAFSIVGMAYQSQYVNRAIPDDRVARSTTRDATAVSLTYIRAILGQKQTFLVILQMRHFH